MTIPLYIALPYRPGIVQHYADSLVYRHVDLYVMVASQIRKISDQHGYIRYRAPEIAEIREHV